MTTNKKMVHVYLSSVEKVRVEKAAAQLGISVSSYMKVKLFSGGEGL
jgi:hypothetical protein